MALGKTFEALSVQLDELFRAADGLQRAARDEPAEQPVALVRILDDAADDVHGWLANALAAVERGREAIAPPLDLERAGAELVRAKDAYFVATERLATLLTPERLMEITGAGQERGGEWREWAAGVRDALDQCRTQDRTVLPALFACFEEIAEHATTTVTQTRSPYRASIPETTTGD
jgi:hypothetical protein